MKKISLFLYMCIIVSCTVSGWQESEENFTPEAVSDVSFTMEIDGECGTEVRSILTADVESKVSDLTLASYGADGRLTEARYYDSGFDSMLLSVKSDGVSNIYALVNMGDMSGRFPQKETEVPGMEYRIQSYDEIDHKGFPMSGVLRGYAPERSVSVIDVYRLFAKLCVRITHAGLSGYSPSSYYSYNMCNKSLYVRQANRRLLPFSEQNSKALSAADILDVSDSYQNLNDKNAYQGSLSQSGLGPGPGYAQDTTLVFYVPENVQGNLLPENDDPFGKVYEEISDIGGQSYSDLCTYLEFNARRENTQGYSGDVMYRYYLGADNTSDFSLVRNKRYDVTLDFTEDGFFAESWKVTRGGDWNDTRVLKFLGDSFSVQPGESADIMIHYHRAGRNGVDSQHIPGDWMLQVDDEAMASAGLTYSFDPSVLITGKNGYKDFCLRVVASGDARVGASIPITAVTYDGRVADRTVISVAAPSAFSPKWSFRPEYVAQEGMMSFPDIAESDLPLSVSLSDGSKVSCMGISDRSFRIIALEPGSVTICVRNALGSKSAVTQLDIKAPSLEVDRSSLILNPDGETVTVSYRYRDAEGKILTDLNASAFDSILLPVVETKSCFAPDVSSSVISLKIVSLNVDGGSLELGKDYSAVVKASGCEEVSPEEITLQVKNPFAGMITRDYGYVDDYTLFSQSNVNSVLKTRFQDKIEANKSFEYQTIVPSVSSQYVSAALEPAWAGNFSNANGVFKAEFNPASGKIKLSYNSLLPTTEHSAGRHNMMLYVTNRYSKEKIGLSCGTLDVYVHTAIGAKAVFGSQNCINSPYGNETFALVYNRVAGRTVYTSTSPSAMVHYIDVSLEWMTDVSEVYVLNRMKTAVQSGTSWMDALDIVRPSVSDGELNPNTRMLYSVMNGSDSRISVAGETYGPRMGIGRILYRALLQSTHSGTVSGIDLKFWFFGYQPSSGRGAPAMAPCYTLHDMTKGADMQNNKVITRTPYHFCPSSCGAYVDEQGRGYHIIHFLEEICPETCGWINLL